MTGVVHQHSPNEGITMSKALLNRKTAVVALAATALLAGGVAYAYPNGTQLTVSARATPAGDGQAEVLVTIANADPRCATRIRVEGAPETVFAPGVLTGTVSIPISSGRFRVAARALDCEERERARSEFVILDARAAGESATVPRRTNFEVAYTGLDPASTVTATATLQGSDPLVQVSESDDVDRRGEATAKFRFRRAGVWVITTESTPPGTTINAVTVEVV